MKIAIVCPEYYPHIGGVETCVKEISERLTKRGFEIKVLTTCHSEEWPKEEVINGVEVRKFGSLAPNRIYDLPSPSMLFELTRQRVDIIHAYNIHAWTSFVAYVAHRMHTKPRFVISPFYHGRGQTKLADILWVPYRPFARKIVQDADAIVVNSRAQKALIETTFKPSSRRFIVYDGTNLAEIENAEPFALDAARRVLLYIGRLEKYKNVHIAIESMKYLPEDYHFYIIGRGTFGAYLQKCATSNNLQDRVHFLGYQPNNVAYRWLKTADVFVHLSAVESFGMTCIESLAAGTPVIANDDGLGLSETIALYPQRIRKFKVGKETVSKLASQISEVAELKPITVDVSQFSWGSIAERLEMVYEHVYGRTCA